MASDRPRLLEAMVDAGSISKPVRGKRRDHFRVPRKLNQLVEDRKRAVHDRGLFLAVLPGDDIIMEIAGHA
jgi:hypothetical protein